MTFIIKSFTKEKTAEPQPKTSPARRAVTFEENEYPPEVGLPQRRHYGEENLMLGSEQHEARRERLREERHQDMREVLTRQILKVLLMPVQLHVHC